jgi:hypothetical protein
MRQMKPSQRTRLVRVAWLILASAFLLGCDSWSSPPRISSYSNLHRIGVALRDYRDDHGMLPQHLSDLVPQYISTNQLGIFYTTNAFARPGPIPPDWASNPTRIDQFSSYVYLGTNSQCDVVAFERTNLWITTTAHSNEVAVLFVDFHVQYVSCSGLQTMLHDGRKPK